MLAKFETKSPRVKGLSFHPTRPWILCSLHDGQIQLWDYRVGTLLDIYKEHNGPVRTVDFHSSQPLFVSGGDDYKIRIWNYNTKRSLFTLLGHQDYVRSVQFHSENPWIVSCSDDQTVRIWNWQSRECIAVLSGHNHYVMSAQFHPHEDLVVSASLDQTVRVWDISSLKKKGKSLPGMSTVPASMMGRLGMESSGTVKYILEGHERGVNWASFHPELPLIVSASDDRMIKIWRTNDAKAWEVGTLRGHSGNVCCVLFHPREDLIISDSEDHSIRVWDSTKRIAVQTFVRARDRFWILAAHKTQNLIAAGHDSGTVVFKLRRERIPFSSQNNYCFYVKDHSYRVYEYTNRTRDYAILQTSRGPAFRDDMPRFLQYNTFCTSDNMLLMHNQADGGIYELIHLPCTIDSGKSVSDVISGNSMSVCFVSRNKFVSLESGDSLFIRNFDNIVTKRINLPIPGCSHIYSAGQSGRVLLKSGDIIYLFDTSSQEILGQALISGVKRVLCCADGMMAFFTSHSVYIVDKNMIITCFITEKLRVKDGIWDNNGVVIYATLSQIKYLLPSGEQGVIRSLDEPIYFVDLRGDILFGFDRDGKMVRIQIDTSEYLFKLYLEKRKYREAIQIIRSKKVDSQAIVSYLQRNGFEDIALHFVTEPRARFNLAMRSGNLDVICVVMHNKQIALECANDLGETAVWLELAEEALRQGNHEMVEMAFQRTKSFDKLSFLYVITGNTSKLQKMLKIAEMRGDVMSRFHNALYLGDVESRVQVLLDVGQTTLAYVTAATYGLSDIAASLRAELEEQELPVPAVSAEASLLVPPIAVSQGSNWPLLEMPRSAFDRIMDDEIRGISVDETPDEVADEVTEKVVEKEEKELVLSDDDAGDAWDDDLDLDDDVTLPTASSDTITAGTDIFSHWCDASSMAADHAAAGNMESACRLLNRQIGAAHVTLLTSGLRQCFLSTQTAMAGFPGMPMLNTPMTRVEKLPLSSYHLSYATRLVKSGMKAFQGARLEETTSSMRQLLQVAPLVVVDGHGEEGELLHYIDCAREYIIAARLEMRRAACEVGSAEALALAAYLTQCKLQTSHQLLVLNSAMVAAFKAGNYIDAAIFANRVLSNAEIKSPRNASLEQKARKVLTRSEKEGRNAVAVEYDPESPFVIDCSTLTPLGRGDVVKCPFCGSIYGSNFGKKLCIVCELSIVGVDTLGLVCCDSRK